MGGVIETTCDCRAPITAPHPPQPIRSSPTGDSLIPRARCVPVGHTPERATMVLTHSVGWPTGHHRGSYHTGVWGHPDRTRGEPNMNDRLKQFAGVGTRDLRASVSPTRFVYTR